MGFRPFTVRLAAEQAVRGEVHNDGEGVLIHAEGADLDRFAADLAARAPALARVEAIERSRAAPRPGLTGFAIRESATGTVRTAVTPDAATCADCRAEIADPLARRYRYAFTTCTQCGPRFSIVTGVPYDRAATTMASFAMCPTCRREYEDPADRRFHAQANACPACGPRLWLEVGGEEQPGDAVAGAVALLRVGAILAVKGMGGFHLACDARNQEAVLLLRARKRRPGKPLAVMAPDLATVARFAEPSAAEAALLAGPEGPIVLLEAAGEALAPAVAPGQWALGWLLPPTPLHHLLLEAFGGPLVMTSGNRAGEPQAIGHAEARSQLGPFVDGFLLHDRTIARRLDDSLVLPAAGAARLLRRARGHAPASLPMPPGLAGAPPVAAYGGQLKAALCLTADGRALLSQHLGDLDDAATAQEFARAERDYALLVATAPEVIACDLHPDYRSTAHAEARARELGAPLERVQHHHAHVASAMAEARWPVDAGPVLGVVLDGLGLGDDGTVWGGEFLLCDYSSFARLASLRPVPLPGGDAAQREPWRNLVAQLDGCGLAAAADRLLPGRPLGLLRAAVAGGINAPLSSSAGRLFDAVAAAVGVAPDHQSYEGEAAMLLEELARRGLAGDAAAYPFVTSGVTLECGPMWAALLADLDAGVPSEAIAARFHRGLAGAVAGLAGRLATAHGARAIALSGGCFQSRTLLELCLAALRDRVVLTHAKVPPNDGGLALGQAVVAAARHRTGP